jgi:hypothetical protein
MKVHHRTPQPPAEELAPGGVTVGFPSRPLNETTGRWRMRSLAGRRTLDTAHESIDAAEPTSGTETAKEDEGCPLKS